jgi:hypothetical protein
MDAWRERLAASRRQFREDDEEDELNIRMVLGHFHGGVDEEPLPRVRGGSRPGRARNIDRERQLMHQRMILDYFCDTPVFGPSLFRRRYRMRRSLFMEILEKICAHDRYFVQKVDACGLMGLSSHQKITCALRMLAYGVCADATDEYCRVSESTAMECLKRFCVAVRAVFGEYHLRQPTREDYEKQLQINSDRGFPGMFASLDCMHWEWKNCPVAWQGDFGDRDGKKSIILEAIADASLHIWHVFFGLPGSNNDITVLDRSPLIHNMLTGEARDMHYVVNGCEYDRYYLLADGIYAQWSCFVQSIALPSDEKRAHFAERQEAVRKDVERCFGVLQGRFAIVKNPCRQWSMDVISDIMFACCILHNMILEDEVDVAGLDDIFGDRDGDVHARVDHLQRGLTFDQLLTSTVELENQDTHFSLRGDLIEHLWAIKGANMA